MQRAAILLTVFGLGFAALVYWSLRPILLERAVAPSDSVAASLYVLNCEGDGCELPYGTELRLEFWRYGIIPVSERLFLGYCRGETSLRWAEGARLSVYCQHLSEVRSMVRYFEGIEIEYLTDSYEPGA